MSVMSMPYNHEADPITQETEVITPELADRISARIALHEPTPVEFVWRGLEVKADKTRRWRLDVKGEQTKQRAEKRATHLYNRYERAEGERNEELADDLWDLYEAKNAKATKLRHEHEQLVNRRTMELRIKGVGCLVGAALATSYIGIPLRWCALGYGSIGLGVTGVLVARSLFSLGSAQHRQASRKRGRKQQRPTKPARPVVSHLELVTDSAIEEEPEPFEDRLQILRDILAVQEEGETRAFTGEILQRLQDPELFADTYVDLTVQAFSRQLDALGAKPIKKRIGSTTRSNIYFDTQINKALQLAEAI